MKTKHLSRFLPYVSAEDAGLPVADALRLMADRAADDKPPVARKPVTAERFYQDGVSSARNGNARSPGNESRMPIAGMGRSWQSRAFARGFSDTCYHMGQTVLPGD